MNKFIWSGAVATLSLAAPLAGAAEAEVKANADLPKSRAEFRTERETTVRAEADKEKVRASDKASGLIGMEVRNRQNENLGEIKDLVLDLNSGKISYAVLAVGGFLGLGEKMIALPPGALRVSNDRGHLILDADKSKIQAAPGFAATAWPSVNDPQINQYWKFDASGAAAETETRRESGKVKTDVDVDLDREDAKLEGEIKTKKDKIYTDADEDKKVEVEVKKD